MYMYSANLSYHVYIMCCAVLQLAMTRGARLLLICYMCVVCTLCYCVFIVFCVYVCVSCVFLVS